MNTNKIKMMALGLAIAGSAMFANAKQYCGEVLTQVVNETTYSITFTAQKLSEGVYQLLIEGEGLTGLGGSFMNVNGVGGYDIRTNMVVAGDGTSITVNINSTSDPSFHTPLYVLMPGEVNFGNLYDIEWGSCGTAVEDNEAPVMGTATVGTVTHNSATIAVTATDNVGVLLYHVTDVANAIDQRIAPADGNITLTGLASDTEYNLTITALDAAGNESANNATASFTTGELVYHDFPTGHLGDAEFGDENGRITLTIAKKSDTSVAFIINPNNENGFIDYVEVKVSGQNPVSFGEAGGDTSAASHELLVEGVTFPLTVEYIRWHTASQDLAGRWTINTLVVNENELYVEEPGSGTGLPHMQADNMRVIARDGLLHVTTDAPAAIRVYNLQGMCVAEAEAAELHTALPAGTYVVAANGQAVKVALR